MIAHALLAIVSAFVLAEDNGSIPPRIKPTNVPVILDGSGSMEGGKAKAMKEGGKLFVAMLDDDQHVTVVDFNQAARTSTPFPLKTPQMRQVAMRHIDSLAIGGGTNYIQALTVAKSPDGSPSIFISDGEHNGDPAEVIQFIKANWKGPIFTVAVEAPPQAKKLLMEMAAMTGGSYVAVENAEELAKTFLELAKFVGNYRTYRPDEDQVKCHVPTGTKLVAFGFDTSVRITAAPPPGDPIYEHTADLPQSVVNLAAAAFRDDADVTVESVNKLRPSGHLAAILRDDLARSHMQLSAVGGTAAAGSQVTASTGFTGRQGQQIDPRQRKDLSSEYQVLDDKGNVLSKAVGQPSPDKPALQATLNLPNQAGPVTIRNITGDSSQGPSFEATENQTLILVKPLRLAAVPSPVSLSAKEGRFVCEVQIAVLESKEPLTDCNVRIAGDSPHLRIIGSEFKQGTLAVEFEARRPGRFRGTWIVEGSALTLVELLQVPFDFEIAPKFLGLALPASREMSLGSVFANAGAKKVATWQIPSLDEQDPPSYTVEVTDLSNDSGAVIPLSADQTTVTPTKTEPALLTLSADVCNAPSGVYTSRVTFKLVGSAPKEWTTLLKLSVNEPLSVTELDFGKIEIGKTAKRRLTIKNAAGALRGLTLSVAPVTREGAAVDTTEIVLTAPAQIPLLDAQQETAIDVQLAVSPLVKSRGVHRSEVCIRRAAGADVRVPISIQVVEPGEGVSALLVSPQKLQLTASPGEVARFELRLKLSPDGPPADEITASAGVFKGAQDQKCEVTAVLDWPKGQRIARTMPLTAKGYLLAPDKPGTYTSQFTISSRNSGTTVIPVSIEVK